MENDGTNELALVYEIPDLVDSVYHTTAVRVLKHSAAAGWSTAFDEQIPKMLDNDITRIERLRGPQGQEALLVITRYSGAGAATNWHVLASVRGKISKLDPMRQRAKVLNDRGYRDWGYNSATAKGNYVIENQPGYSRKTARCCPDRPSIEMVFKFTGNSIVLQTVNQLPFTPAKH